jgi:hypothetical protein
LPASLDTSPPRAAYAAIPGDAQASYEVDNACELAYERQNEYLAQQAAEEDAQWWRERGIHIAEDLLRDPEGWLGEDWWECSYVHHSPPDIDLEAF